VLRKKLKWNQVILREMPEGGSCGYIRLNPEGRRQTK